MACSPFLAMQVDADPKSLPIAGQRVWQTYIHMCAHVCTHTYIYTILRHMWFCKLDHIFVWAYKSLIVGGYRYVLVAHTSCDL